MEIRTRLVASCLLTAFGVAVALAPHVSVFGQNQKESFTGFAINMNSGPNTATVDFTMERWSTDAEREQLLSIVKEEKDEIRMNQKLLQALQKMPKTGYIKTGNTLAWDLRFARQSKLENGGRQIVLATDRPIAFAETRNQSRTLDYPFTIVEIHLDKNNRGEGKILVGTKITVDKNNNLGLEHYGQQPVAFNDIKPLK